MREWLEVLFLALAMYPAAGAVVLAAVFTAGLAAGAALHRAASNRR